MEQISCVKTAIHECDCQPLFRGYTSAVRMKNDF